MALQRLVQVGGRIRGRQMDLLAGPCQRNGDRGGHRRLADATLAHQHDEPVIGPGKLIDKRAER